MSVTSDILFTYLREMFYAKPSAELDITKLEEDYVMLGKGLMYIAHCLAQYYEFANALAKGDLSIQAPPPENELASPLKSLHASLKHVTWQSQQVAKGDYKQRVDFMGEFADAFNTMVEQLADRQYKLENEINVSQKHAQALEHHAYRDALTGVYNRFFGMMTLNEWVDEKKQFALIFVDMDNLKYVNDKHGHQDGDIYIINVANHLREFSQDTVLCRVGGDEFMLLIPSVDGDAVRNRMEELQKEIQSDKYLEGKDYYYSISYGIVHVDENNDLTSSNILSIADERMYEHKRARKKERQQ